MTLPKCVEVWGWNPPQAGPPDCLSLKAAAAAKANDPDASPTIPAVGAGDRTTPRAGAASNVRCKLVVKRHSVVVPVVPPRFLSLVFARRKVFREIAVMRRLPHHPNILQLLDVCEQVQDNRCCLHIVLELADGGELFDRIKLDQGCSESVACAHFQQLLAGVQFCHNHGVAHRDLKPENLLLTENDSDPAVAGLGRARKPGTTRRERGREQAHEHRHRHRQTTQGSRTERTSGSSQRAGASTKSPIPPGGPHSTIGQFPPKSSRNSSVDTLPVPPSHRTRSAMLENQVVRGALQGTRLESPAPAIRNGQMIGGDTPVDENDDMCSHTEDDEDDDSSDFDEEGSESDGDIEDVDNQSDDTLLKDADGVTLKIADFGLSAVMAAAEDAEAEAEAAPLTGPGGGLSVARSTAPTGTGGLRRMDGIPSSITEAGSLGFSTPQSLQPRMPLSSSSALAVRRLQSIVGSPHYCAPEVLGVDHNKIEAGSVKIGSRGEVISSPGKVGTSEMQKGYDGAKVDAWSCGVILYALLAGKLPFGSNLATCNRFHQWSIFVRQTEEEQAAMLRGSFATAAASSGVPTKPVVRRLEPHLDDDVTTPLGGKRRYSATGTSDFDRGLTSSPSPMSSSPPESPVMCADYQPLTQEIEQVRPLTISKEEQIKLKMNASLWPPETLPEFPEWFILRKFSDDAKRLLAGLLHPSPQRRWTVAAALGADWTVRGVQAIMAARSRRRARQLARRERRRIAKAERESLRTRVSGMNATDAGAQAGECMNGALAASSAQAAGEGQGQYHGSGHQQADHGSVAIHANCRSRATCESTNELGSNIARDLLPVTATASANDEQLMMADVEHDEAAGRDEDEDGNDDDEDEDEDEDDDAMSAPLSEAAAGGGSRSILSAVDGFRGRPQFRGCMSAPMVPMGASSELAMPDFSLGSSALDDETNANSSGVGMLPGLQISSPIGSNPISPVGRGASLESSTGSTKSRQATFRAMPTQATSSTRDGNSRSQFSSRDASGTTQQSTGSRSSGGQAGQPSIERGLMQPRARDPRDSIGFSPALGAMPAPGSGSYLHYGAQASKAAGMAKPALVSVQPPALPPHILPPAVSGSVLREATGPRKDSSQLEGSSSSSSQPRVNRKVVRAKLNHDRTDKPQNQQQPMSSPSSPTASGDDESISETGGQEERETETRSSDGRPLPGPVRRYPTNPDDAIRHAVSGVVNKSGGGGEVSPRRGGATSALPCLADRLPRLDPDHSVRRSSRVITSVPATVVLARISELIKTKEDLLLGDALEGMARMRLRGRGEESGGRAPEGSESQSDSQVRPSHASHGGAISQEHRSRTEQLKRDGDFDRLRMARAASAPSDEHSAHMNTMLYGAGSADIDIDAGHGDKETMLPADVVDTSTTGIRRSMTEMAQATKAIAGNGAIVVNTDWRACKLEARLAGERILEVRVLLHPRDPRLQVVEVLRAGLGIFAFKRFFEALRQHLSRVIRE